MTDVAGQLSIESEGRRRRTADRLGGGAEDRHSEHERRVAGRVASATDQELAGWLRPAEDRLRMVDNFVADMKARLPSIEREQAAIRQNIRAVRERLERPAA